MNKNCLVCKWSDLYPEQPGYSEVTPGSPASWSCSKRRWKDNPLTLDKREFLKLIEKAKTCKDFKNYEE